MALNIIYLILLFKFVMRVQSIGDMIPGDMLSGDKPKSYENTVTQMSTFKGFNRATLDDTLAQYNRTKMLNEINQQIDGLSSKLKNIDENFLFKTKEASNKIELLQTNVLIEMQNKMNKLHNQGSDRLRL